MKLRETENFIVNAVARKLLGKPINHMSWLDEDFGFCKISKIYKYNGRGVVQKDFGSGCSFFEQKLSSLKLNNIQCGNCIRYEES